MTICLLGWLVFAMRRWENPTVEFLGAEYDAIANAIRAGKGFSNPFGYDSGPTAWMPPGGPYLLSCVYWIARDHRPAVIEILHACQPLVLLFSLAPVCAYCGRARGCVLTMMLVSLGVWVHADCLFGEIHDQILMMPLLTLLWISLRNKGHSSALKTHPIAQGILGGTMALFSPTVGLVWAIIYSCENRRHLMRPIVAGLLAIIVVTPWTARNYHCFGNVIPIKSNASFEAWQSSVVDSDGVLDIDTFYLHPYVETGVEERENYIALGEAAYLREKSDAFQAWLRMNPLRLVNRITNRFTAAIVWYRPVARSEYGTVGIYSKRIWTIIGLLSIVTVLCDPRVTIPHDSGLALCIWLLYLSPYILVSYYDRYFWPTLPMQFLVIGRAVSCLCDRIGNQSNTKSRATDVQL
ncbi:MAG: hypothetical protein WBD20_19840 [Pirellulaceae bacterium]